MHKGPADAAACGPDRVSPGPHTSSDGSQGHADRAALRVGPCDGFATKSPLCGDNEDGALETACPSQLRGARRGQARLVTRELPNVDQKTRNKTGGEKPQAGMTRGPTRTGSRVRRRSVMGCRARDLGIAAGTEIKARQSSTAPLGPSGNAHRWLMPRRRSQPARGIMLGPCAAATQEDRTRAGAAQDTGRRVPCSSGPAASPSGGRARGTRVRRGLNAVDSLRI